MKLLRVRREPHKEAHLLPCGDLFVGPDPGRVKAVARSFVGDKSRFADDEGSRYARTRGIVLDGKIGVGVLVVPPVSCHGRHNHAVLRGDGADLDGLEELSHRKASLWFICLLGAEVAT